MTQAKDRTSLEEIKKELAQDPDFLKGLIQPLLQEVLESQLAKRCRRPVTGGPRGGFPAGAWSGPIPT